MRLDSRMKLSSFFNLGSVDALIPPSALMAAAISSRRASLQSGLAHRSSSTFVAVVAVVWMAAIFKKSIILTSRSGYLFRPWADSASHCNMSL